MSGEASVHTHREASGQYRMSLSTKLDKKTDHGTQSFEWLLHSGIQDHSGEPDFHGGINAWFDMRTGLYPFIYSEIVGYGVNAHLFRYTRTKDERYLEAAQEAGQWLIDSTDAGTGLVYTRINQPAFNQPYFNTSVFAFDQWVIIYGLACLGRIDKNAPYLDKALSLAEFLMARMINQDGSFEPMFNLGENRAESPGGKWSRQSGAFHGKALMGLTVLHDITGDDRYEDVAENLLNFTLGQQRPDGRFITQSDDESTHLHPNLYALEGLLSFALARRRDDVMDRVEQGLCWILDNLNDDGTVYCFYRDERFSPFVRADVLAQTLRVGSVLLQRKRLCGYETAIEKVHEALLQYRLQEGPQAGGFFYGQEENGKVHYHVNAWVTMFAAQALDLYQDFREGGEHYDMSYFV